MVLDGTVHSPTTTPDLLIERQQQVPPKHRPHLLFRSRMHLPCSIDRDTWPAPMHASITMPTASAPRMPVELKQHPAQHANCQHFLLLNYHSFAGWSTRWCRRNTVSTVSCIKSQQVQCLSCWQDIINLVGARHNRACDTLVVLAELSRTAFQTWRH